MTWLLRFDLHLKLSSDLIILRSKQAAQRLLREIIERGLEDMEDYYLAANVLERVRRGEEQIYSLDEVEHSLGLAD